MTHVKGGLPNSLTFTDASKGRGDVWVYPSSPESGLATLSTGRESVLLDTADVVALRDLLNLALRQAGVEPVSDRAHFEALFWAVAACEPPEGSQLDAVLTEFQSTFENREG